MPQRKKLFKTAPRHFLNIIWLVPEQIYHASEAYGIDDIRTSGGYFHMGKVWHELNRVDVAESMFDMVRLSVSRFIQ